jgi:hypothetical protein
MMRALRAASIIAAQAAVGGASRAAMMRARVGRLWRRRADRVDAARTARRGGVIDYYSGGGGGGGYRFIRRLDGGRSLDYLNIENYCSSLGTGL